MAEMKLNVARVHKLGTRVSNIVVDPRLRIRHKSGISWFDKALGGKGLTPSCVAMLTGMPGAGKSTLVRQLADAYTGQGHLVVYNTGEESLEQAKLSLENMGLQNDFMVGQEPNVEKLVAFLKGLQAKNPGKQVIFFQDSIQTLDDPMYADGGAGGNAATTRCVVALHDWAKETYGIVFFIGQATKSGDYRGNSTVKHAVDAHATLKFDTSKKSDTFGCLLFELPKHRFGASGHQFVMKITSKGVVEDETWTPKDEEEEAEPSYDSAAE